MSKITDINQFLSRSSPRAPTLWDSSALFWKEPRADATAEVLRALPDEEMAAVLIKGLFAIYHLSQKHAKLPRKVPDYLYDYALQFEVPIIPAAEKVYESSILGRLLRRKDDIPEDLLDLGLFGTETADQCVHHAVRMHACLAAFVDDAVQAEHVVDRLLQTKAQRTSRRILLQLFKACRQWSLGRQRLKSVWRKPHDVFAYQPRGERS